MINLINLNDLQNKLYNTGTREYNTLKSTKLNKVNNAMTNTSWKDKFLDDFPEIKRHINTHPDDYKELTLAARHYLETYHDACKFVDVAKNVSKRMAATFNRKKSAYEQHNSLLKSSGSLNISRIAHYKTSDNLFHKRTTVRDGKNHGLVVFLDNSASMVTRLGFVANQFLIFALFAKAIGVKFTVYAFTSFCKMQDNDKKVAKEIISDADTIETIIDVYYGIYHQFCIACARPAQMKNCVLGEMTNTPLHEVTVLAYHKAMEYKFAGIENVSITFITDGESTSSFGYNEFIVKDPYSNYTTVTNTDKFIQEMNKMIRMKNIKTFNVLLCGDTSMRKHTIKASRIHTISPEVYEEAIRSKSPIISIDGLNNYNSVALVNELDIIRRRSESSRDEVGSTNVMRLSQQYSVIADHFLDVLVENYALK